VKHAVLVLDEPKCELAKSRRLLAISKVLKARRICALELASSELDTDNLSAKNMTLYETNSIVEEFLLTSLSEQRILEVYLRRHPTPKEKELKSLKIRLEVWGTPLGQRLQRL
jgi:hypothetical protein